MVVHIEDGSREKLCLYKTLVESTCLIDFCHQLLRNQLACLVVESIGLQHLWVIAVVLHELAWQLHEVAWGVSSCQRLISSLRHQTVQCVTKLVEEGLHIVHREKRWVACGRFVEVTHIDDHRAMIHTLSIHILWADIVHPSTWTLTSAWEVVGVEDTHQTTISIGHFEYLYLRVIYWHILQLLKFDTKQLGCQIKRTLAHIAELEVRFQLLLVQSIFLHTQFLCIIPPIPWLKFLAWEIFVEKFLQFRCLALSSLQTWFPYALEESIHGLSIMCHTVCQDIISRIIITEELCFLHAKLHGANNHILVVVLVVVVATGGVSHEEFFAQVTVLAVLENRGETSAFRSKQPCFRTTSSHSLFFSSSFCTLRQTCQLCLIGNKELVCVGLIHYIVTKLQREQTKLLVDFFQSCFLILWEVCTILSKRLKCLGQESHLLIVKTQCLTLLIYSLHALEKGVIEDNTVAQL